MWPKEIWCHTINFGLNRIQSKTSSRIKVYLIRGLIKGTKDPKGNNNNEYICTQKYIHYL